MNLFFYPVQDLSPLIRVASEIGGAALITSSTRQDPMDHIANLAIVLGLERDMIFLVAVDLDFRIGGDVFEQLLFRVRLASVLVCDLSVRRAVFFLVNRVAFEAATLFHQRERRFIVDLRIGNRSRHQAADCHHGRKDFHFLFVSS